MKVKEAEAVRKAEEAETQRIAQQQADAEAREKDKAEAARIAEEKA